MPTETGLRGVTAADGEAPPMIAVTRIRPKHAWLVFPALVRFRRLYAEARGDPGFVRGQVTIADPRALVNSSVWQ